jgi:hypothetical protein
VWQNPIRFIYPIVNHIFIQKYNHRFIAAYYRNIQAVPNYKFTLPINQSGDSSNKKSKTELELHRSYFPIQICYT